LDPLEEEALRRSSIHRVPAGDIGRKAAESIARRAGTTHPLYLHLDLDVLDPSVGRANPYAAPGGASLEALVAFVAAIRAHASLAAVTLSAYDPASDPDGRISGAALRLAEAAVGDRG
ncbi:MAG TPA: arginase family protein, partial [Gemmatimonadaceae bacterium]